MLNSIFKKHNKIIIYGAGKDGSDCYEMLKLIDIFPVFFVVSNEVNIKQNYDIPIFEVSKLMDVEDDFLLVIASRKYKDEMRKTIDNLAIKRNYEIVLFEDVISFSLEKLAKNKEHKLFKELDSKIKPIIKDNISIYFDGQPFSMQKRGGISRYIYELKKGLAKNKNVNVSFFEGVSITDFSEHELKDGMYEYCSNRDLGEKINDNIIRNSLSKLMFEYFSDKHSIYDVYHATYYDSYDIKNARVKVVTIYDLIHEKYSLDRYISNNKKIILNNTDGIIAISESTKKDLIEIYGIDEKKIKVIYLANSISFKPDKKSYFDYPYILFVGNRNSYKNFNKFVEAYAQSIIKKDLKLICFGGGVFSSEEKEIINRLGMIDSIIQIGGDDQILANLYANAEFFVYPSLYEGFGIPVLEAMHYGTPVITSNSSSLPEVAGDSAVFVDPSSIESMIDAMEKVAFDEELREMLSIKGKKREKLFSWNKCAAETLEYYNVLLKGVN